MKILVGVGDPTSSQSTLRALAAQFSAKDTEVRILNAVAPMIYFAPPEMAVDYGPELDDRLEQAEKWVKEIAQSLTAMGFRVTTDVEQGDVREVILDAAKAWPADLILIGSHGTSGVQRFLLGSVAEFVAHHADCSVQIVRSAAAG